MRQIDARTLRAWRDTQYCAGDVCVRIGRRSHDLDQMLRRLGRHSGAFVTAWNPHGRKMPLGWNRRSFARLCNILRHLPNQAGKGIGRGWQEAHVLVVADPDRVAVLARQFQQLGIVVVKRGQKARLRLIPDVRAV